MQIKKYLYREYSKKKKGPSGCRVPRRGKSEKIAFHLKAPSVGNEKFFYVESNSTDSLKTSPVAQK